VDYCSYTKFSGIQNETSSCNFEADHFVRCKLSDEYAFVPFEFEETLVTEWGLECDFFKLSMIGSAFMIGLLIGSFLFGSLADKVGRKLALLLAIICSSSGSLIGAFMPEYYSYLFTRVLTAIGAQGIFLCPFLTTVEIVGPTAIVPYIPWRIEYKTLAGSMIQAPFAIGMALLSWVASYIKNWRTLQWTLSLATFAQLILWFFVPESPRWLLATNKTDKAKEAIEKIARRNGVKDYKFDPNKYTELESKETSKHTNTDKNYQVKDILHPSLRKISVILMICWPIVTLGYYGITFSMANLNDDLFLSFILSSLIEIPAYLAVALLMDVWGRKPLFSLSLILSGALCIGCGVLDKGTTRTVLAMFGKLFASSSFSLVYMYTAELYPTTIRSSGVGVCSLMARIGGFSAPFIATSLPKVAGTAAPYLVMGGFSILGGLLSLLLPETLGSNLPDTMEDIENIKANSKPIWKCGRQIK